MTGSVGGPRWIERRVDLRWRDVDALGHVNHTIYLAYMSEVRDALGVAALGVHAREQFVLARIEVDYRAEVELDDEWVTARASLLRIGTTSMRTLEEVVRPDGVLAARAESVSVLTDRATSRPRPFTAEERAGLEVLLGPGAA